MMEKLKFDSKGLIPAVIQDAASRKVLTLCYMNREALEKTLSEGKVYVFRRSKSALMLKGGTSGHIQVVKAVYVDCEENSILVEVEQKVAACHAGYFTCYYRRITPDGSLETTEKTVFDPEKVYRKHGKRHV
jgi:phosphoribosyl-AMP cyclohydrolase